MFYRGPGFLAVAWFGSSPIPLPPSPVCKLSLFLSLPECRLELTDGRKGWEGLGEEPNHMTALVWFGLAPPSLSNVSKLSLFLSLPACHRSSLAYWMGENDGEKARSSIKHSIFNNLWWRHSHQKEYCKENHAHASFVGIGESPFPPTS